MMGGSLNLRSLRINTRYEYSLFASNVSEMYNRKQHKMLENFFVIKSQISFPFSVISNRHIANLTINMYLFKPALQIDLSTFAIIRNMCACFCTR